MNHRSQKITPTSTDDRISKGSISSPDAIHQGFCGVIRGEEGVLLKKRKKGRVCRGFREVHSGERIFLKNAGDFIIGQLIKKADTAFSSYRIRTIHPAVAATIRTVATTVVWLARIVTAIGRLGRHGVVRITPPP